APDRAELLDPLNLGAEAHAARAVDAARHVRRDQRPEILVLHDALLLGVARHAAAEAEREVLQLALAALIADRAVERMVDQQELHRRLLRRDRALRAREDLHAVHDGRRARGGGLRRLLDLDEAHPAVRRDAELVVVTEARDVDPRAIGYLDQHFALARLERHAVDFDLDRVVAHVPLRLTPRR